MSFVNLFVWSIVAEKTTNILIFYICNYGGEYGAESNTEHGGK